MATEDELHRMRHSTAHVMAEAVAEEFPGAKVAIGPAIEDGFYYDFDLPRPVTPEDIAAISGRMRETVQADLPFVHEEWPKEQARHFFGERGQDFKLELIQEIPDATVSIYRHGDFVDLCLGPHVERTGQIGAFKLLNIAGAYWRGDERKPMLQRIYGTVWPSQDELDQYLWRLEEAKRRDHRKIGRELDLFMISEEVGPGLPMWLPKGSVIRRELEDYILGLERRRGYQHVYTPDLAKVDLYRTSGHWGHYQSSMYPPMVRDDEEFVLRPMNCPHHIQIYRYKSRSYRDLPLRLAELGTMYRYEKSGELTGLSRVRAMTLNDAHIFCRPEQVREEFVGVVQLIQETYETLGFKDYWYQLSLRDPSDMEKYVEGDEMWNRAEAACREALDSLGLEYLSAPGEAAFYGPKLDVQVKTALGKDETISTVQLDFYLPQRFELEYAAPEGGPQRPVMIHRGVISTLERMVAFLTENYVGAFPVWLSPVQAVVIPIADRHNQYAASVAEALRDRDFRADVDARREKMQYKIREAQQQKVPYMLVVGDRELETNSVSVRLRSEENLGPQPLEAFIQTLQQAVDARQ